MSRSQATTEDDTRPPRLERLVLASGNKKKRAELERLLSATGVHLETLADHQGLEEPVEDGDTFAANARIKATGYARALSAWCVADDSGLEVDALGGSPGVYSARYAGESATDEENNDRLLRELDGVDDAHRGARFRCAIALCDPEGRVHFEANGSTEGRVLHARQGHGGFGYDPLFHSTEIDRCFGEVPSEEKDRVSHRGRAMRQLVTWLKSGTPAP